MHDRNQTIRGFLDAAAAKQPTPGGGSVAALTGALASAMGEMVLNYSIGKMDLIGHDTEQKAALAGLTRARDMLLELMEEDQLAYQAMRDIQKLPADSSERKEREPAVITTCVRVPQAIAATALAILEIAEKVVLISNKYLLSDLAVCAELSMATLRSGIYNVRINLPLLKEEQDRVSLVKSTDQMLASGVKIVQSLLPKIWQIVEKSA